MVSKSHHLKQPLSSSKEQPRAITKGAPKTAKLQRGPQEWMLKNCTRKEPKKHWLLLPWQTDNRPVKSWTFSHAENYYTDQAFLTWKKKMPKVTNSKRLQITAVWGKWLIVPYSLLLAIEPKSDSLEASRRQQFLLHTLLNKMEELVVRAWWYGGQECKRIR